MLPEMLGEMLEAEERPNLRGGSTTRIGLLMNRWPGGGGPTDTQ